MKIPKSPNSKIPKKPKSPKSQNHKQIQTSKHPEIQKNPKSPKSTTIQTSATSPKSGEIHEIHKLSLLGVRFAPVSCNIRFEAAMSGAFRLAGVRPCRNSGISSGGSDGECPLKKAPGALGLRCRAGSVASSSIRPCPRSRGLRTAPGGNRQRP